MKKRILLFMAMMVVFILSLNSTVFAQPVTWYVNSEIGSDGYDGLSPDRIAGSGPFLTINRAIQKAIDGDTISVAYTPSKTYAGPTVSAATDKNLFFSVTDPTAGTPVVRQWRTNKNHTFVNDFIITELLWLYSGTIDFANGAVLTVEANSIVNRRLGSITQSPNYTGFCDFIYSDGSLTAGPELPSATNIIFDLDINNAGTIITITEDKYINGTLTAAGSINLADDIITLHLTNSAAATSHTVRQILNGTVFFHIAGGDVDIVVNSGNAGGNLPDVKGEVLNGTNRDLVLETQSPIGIVTNTSLTLDIQVLSPGITGNLPPTIEGLVNEAGGLITISPGGVNDAIDVTTLVWSHPVAGGVIDFNNLGIVDIGELKIEGGTVQFNRNAASTVTVSSNATFTGGNMVYGVDPLVGIVRDFELNGESIIIDTPADFFGTAANTDYQNALIKLAGPAAQTLRVNSEETPIYGPFEIDNAAGVTMRGYGTGIGRMRVLHDVTFTNGNVLLQGCKLFVGGRGFDAYTDAHIIGGIAFTNSASFTTDVDGRVILRSSNPMNFNGIGSCGNFEVDLTGGDNASVTGTQTFTDYLYLVEGRLDAALGTVVINGLNPYIVRDKGLLLQGPTFNSIVNLIYRGEGKNAGNEVPNYGGDPDKLKDVIVETVKNNVDPTSRRGRVRFNRQAQINGTLTINENQGLLIEDGRTIHMVGPRINLNGDMTNNNAPGYGVLKLENNSGGTEIVGPGRLPDIIVAAGSDSNKIDGAFSLIRGYMGADGILSADDLIAAVDAGTATITFENSAMNNPASLFLDFAASGLHHSGDVTMNGYSTLFLDADFMQQGVLDHPPTAAIHLREFDYTMSGTTINLAGNAIIDGTGTFNLISTPAIAINLVKDVAAFPTIDANFRMNLGNAVDIAQLNQITADSLCLNGNVKLTQGTLHLDFIPIENSVAARGDSLTMENAASIAGDGVLHLDPVNPPMIFAVAATPTLANLTVQDSVTLEKLDPTVNCNLTVQNAFVHQDGNFNFGDADITIQGSFDRLAGTYDATSGYLILQTPIFSQGNSSFTIPNLKIQAGGNLTVPIAEAPFTVTKNLFLQNNGNFLNHNAKLSLADLATIHYRGCLLDGPINFLGQMRFHSLNTADRNIPVELWPVAPTELVKALIVETKAGKNITLPGSRTVTDSLVLFSGNLVVPAPETFILHDGVITRVDGVINAVGATLDWGDNNSVVYLNNGVPINTGVELPTTVSSLTFAHYPTFVGGNVFTTLMSPVTVKGQNTLYIRNNVRTQLTAPLTVWCDVYIEVDNVPNSQVPTCTFNAPLEFGGPNNQSLVIPNGGIDLTGGGVAPANIRINKTSATSRVTVRGGDITTGTIFFVNGLLDSEDNNGIIIPAPFNGQGQGFDRSGVVAPNVSHIVGNVTKNFTNSGVVNTSTNERSEFPVGNETSYRPVAITFHPSSDYPTVPNNVEIRVSHVNAFPQGAEALPIEDAIAPGRDISAYPGFFWKIQTSTTLSQKVFDLELAATGFDSSNYANVADLRIIRRHGGPGDVTNPWLLQGDLNLYDNAQYTTGPTIINQQSVGGLRSEGALFTLGMEEGTLPSDRFFTKVWDGNPKDPMILYVTKANFHEDAALMPGDEIGVFDDTRCIGVGKVEQQVSQGDPLIIICDEWEILAGNATREITFKLWDQSENVQYTVDNPEFFSIVDDSPVVPIPKFTANESYRVELSSGYGAAQTQNIMLNTGWNIVSLAVAPIATNILLNPAGDQGVFAPIETQLEKITGDGGLSIEKLFTSPDWLIYGDNTWQESEGYYVKVKQDVVLPVVGTPMDSTLDIQLSAGWNLISYPIFSQPQDVAAVFADLINQGFLLKVMNEEGQPFEYLAFFGGWQNHIGSMQPGEGYYVKVNAACTLTINGASGGSAAKVLALQKSEPQHFMLDKTNPYKPMSVYIGQAAINTLELASGDEVAVYNGNQLIGAAAVSEAVSKEQPLVIALAKDDGTENGFEEGDALSFKIWHSASQNEIAVDATDIAYLNVNDGQTVGSTGFKELGSIMVALSAQTDLQIVPTAFELNQNYPNPFNPKTTISFALPKAGKVQVEVYDITGKFVTSLVNQEHSAGVHTVEWNGVNAYGNMVASGVYFYKMTAPGFSQTRKMIFTK